MAHLQKNQETKSIQRNPIFCAICQYATLPSGTWPRVSVMLKVSCYGRPTEASRLDRPVRNYLAPPVIARSLCCSSCASREELSRSSSSAMTRRSESRRVGESESRIVRVTCNLSMSHCTNSLITFGLSLNGETAWKISFAVEIASKHHLRQACGGCHRSHRQTLHSRGR